MNHITAPFTKTQVEELRAWQNSRYIHPYTCPNRTNSPHTQNARDLGVLLVDTSGLTCQDCGYKQFWAFDPKGIFSSKIETLFDE